jgi:hypothetical protein
MDTLLTAIAFLFIGHSQLAGYCNNPLPTGDSSRTALYSFTSHELYYATEADRKSFVPTFLDKMAQRYPKNTFIGIKDSQAGCPMKGWFLPGDQEFNKITEAIKFLRGKVVWGGIFILEGFLEATDTVSIDDMPLTIARMYIAYTSVMRKSNVPLFIAKYEKNSDRSKHPNNFKYCNRVCNKIDSLPMLFPNVYTFPVRYIPKEDFCDDHHYNEAGQKILAEDAVVIYQQSGLDMWYKK